MRFYDASRIESLAVPVEFIEQVMQELGGFEDLVIIGATARDLLASHAGNLPIQRITKDLDVAVAVSTMGRYRHLTARLQARHSEPQFLLEGRPVDVIPFGGVERARHVTFENDHRLDVTGLAEAAASKVSVVLRQDLAVPVASLAAQCALKVLAWRDRRYVARDKNALDLCLLLEASSRGVYEDSVWSDVEALEATAYDVSEAGAYRTGREAAALFESEPRDLIGRLLRDVEFTYQLGRAMSSSSGGRLLAAFAFGYASL